MTALIISRLAPFFYTPSKAGILDPVGVEEIRKLKDEFLLPIVALGGINEGNVETVLDSGVEGIAVISSILGADDAEKASKGLFDKIMKHRLRNTSVFGKFKPVLTRIDR